MKVTVDQNEPSRLKILNEHRLSDRRSGSVQSR